MQILWILSFYFVDVMPLSFNLPFIFDVMPLSVYLLMFLSFYFELFVFILWMLSFYLLFCGCYAFLCFAFFIFLF